MIDGKVEITPKSDGRIDPIQLLKATYDSGVSVAEMRMKARGQIVKNSTGAIALLVQPSQSFAIVRNELSPQLDTLVDSGAFVTVEGLLYQKQKGQKKQALPPSLTLTVLEIQKE